MPIARHRVFVTAILLGCTALAAACSSGGGGGTGTDSTTSGPSSASQSAVAPQSAAASPQGGSGDSAIPVETGPANASLTPVQVGFINTESGGLDLPSARYGFQAAIAYINAKLGGIDGHPMQGVYCAVGADLDSTRKCAEQFADDSSINIVAGGYIIVSDSIYPVLAAAGKPILLGSDFNKPDWTTTNTAISFWPGSPGVDGGTVFYARDFLHAKTVAVVDSASEAGTSDIAAIKAELAAAGVNMTIDPVYVPDTAVDYTTAILASGASSANVFIDLTGPNGCIAVAKALKALDINAKVVSTVECLDPSVVKAVGPLLTGWTIGFAVQPTQLPKGQNAQVDNYNSVFPEYSTQNPNGNGTAQSFSLALSLWKIGNQIGYDKLSPATWMQGMKAFKGPVYLGAPTLSCGKSKLFPGICSLASFWYTVTATGGLQKADGNQSFDPIP